MATTTTTQTGRFGTLSGVFVPNILTILGIILFLRVGEVVGQAGLWGALSIVLIANVISFLTGISLSSIATSMRVRAGGNYYLISRSLGLEIGGAIGIPLYLSQAISVAFYIIGFTEALQSLAFFQQFDPRLIATSVTLLFVVIAYVGADFALRIQYFILFILMAALASFFIGGLMNFGSVEAVTAPNYRPDASFWLMFALFFPAVTGIEVGTSLSGDLKEPSKSIPLGTLSSILFTAVIYLLVVLIFAFTTTADQLLTDNFAMQRVALIPELILAGVWASTLSSALGSVLAAPRTLQAIANDGVVARGLASRMGSKTEPRAAVLLTGAIAVTVIWLGDLNAVAPIISMFFLNTYGMVNLAASIEKLVGNPSYRPRFDTPWFVSLLGALGCYGAMFLIDPAATVVAVVVSYGFYVYLQQRAISHTWGDVRSGVWFALARFALLNLDHLASHPKNWRPNIVVFTGQPHNRQQLVEVARWLSLGHGIVTFFQFIMHKDGKAVNETALRAAAERRIHDFIEKQNMQAFAEAEIVNNFRDGALMVAQAHGIGDLRPNTVLMGWSRNADGRASQMELLRELVNLQKNVLFLKYDFERGYGERKRIKVWWQGRGGNEELMLLLAYLIRQHRSWRGASVQIVRVVTKSEALESTRRHMDTLLAGVRVKAEPVILVKQTPQQAFTEIILEHSRDADLTIMGMALPTADEAAAYSERLHGLVEGVGTVLLVRNAEVDKALLETDA